MNSTAQPSQSKKSNDTYTGFINNLVNTLHKSTHEDVIHISFEGRNLSLESTKKGTAQKQ